ncbi:hypothetical protein IMG5_108270 [Ichthyophthirius multifiliis]|uniref:PPIase FKBP-type domain-containing protein n=1 Tax=Ichthyophthirius multifiliis TaxID=5932 RepID=G0QTG5_ICHMU|nr:hypothetical protein IMG5_108270 [Ichthyophthirius multifiliis]EGR31486.1 hypothetical protein IMG5_108270 [Ichthyophthirius multifiliis]|eukprot:XP_004034972.1 hypothetical protein IMG5_108270 [Ichthyophthirius multifiliis]
MVQQENLTFVNMDETGHIQKAILKEGIGEIPEKHREVLVYFVLRKENGDFVTGTDSNAYKIVIGRNDAIPLMDKIISSMRLGERVLAKINTEYVKQSPKLCQLYTKEEQIQGLELEIELVRLSNYRNNLWELESEEREKAAQQLKQEGNEQIKNKEYQIAAQKYNLALNSIRNDSNETFEELHQSLLNNISLAHLKNGDFNKCVQSASAALVNQQDNLKLLYRRAQAYEGLEQFDKAKEDLKTGLSIDPDNVEFQKELAGLANKEKAQKIKEKKVYENMFK